MRPGMGESGIIWTIWLTYGAFYFCRTNISAAIPGIEAEFKFSKADIGLFLGGLKLAYGFGQLVNGQLAEKLSARKLLTVGMLTSALLNVAFGFGTALYFLIFIWACNGYFQSLGCRVEHLGQGEVLEQDIPGRKQVSPQEEREEGPEVEDGEEGQWPEIPKPHKRSLGMGRLAHGALIIPLRERERKRVGPFHKENRANKTLEIKGQDRFQRDQ